MGDVWGSFGVVLGWFWGGFGVVLGWFWGGFGVVLGWFWGGFGVVLGWFLNKSPSPMFFIDCMFYIVIIFEWPRNSAVLMSLY